MFNSNPGKYLAAWASRNAAAAYRENLEKTMTNAIEQAKREMYRRLEMLNNCRRADRVPYVSLPDFETALESYLELLRQDHEALHETARKRFEDLQVAEADNEDMGIRLAKMTEERDSLRNRMQAYEARESSDGTSGQTSGDRASCATPDAKTMAILGSVLDVQRIVSDWAMGDSKAKASMHKIAAVVNGDLEVAKALDAFQCNEPCKPGEKDWREIAAENEERHEAMKAKAEAERRKYRLQEVKMNCAVAGVVLGINQALWSAMTAPAKKDNCQHSFFAIGQDQMKCTFCGVGK